MMRGIQTDKTFLILEEQKSGRHTVCPGPYNEPGRVLRVHTLHHPVSSLGARWCHCPHMNGGNHPRPAGPLVRRRWLQGEPRPAETEVGAFPLTALSSWRVGTGRPPWSSCPIPSSHRRGSQVPKKLSNFPTVTELACSTRIREWPWLPEHFIMSSYFLARG